MLGLPLFPVKGPASQWESRGKGDLWAAVGPGAGIVGKPFDLAAGHG